MRALTGDFMNELESDIQHLEETLKDFKGCDECRKDHERLLAYLKELRVFRKARDMILITLFSENANKERKEDPFIYEWDNHGVKPV